MIQILVQYFIQYDHLDLTGVGSLKWSKQEASWKDGVIIAPKEHIIFDPIAIKPSKQFYSFLAEELGVSIDQAILKYEAFLDNFTSQTIADLVLGNIGTFSKNASQINWNSHFQSNEFYKDIDLSNTINNQSIDYLDTHTKNDKWWIWALSIAILAVLLIVYKFY